ncbi:MAG TPA: S24 family peptidase [bacterium]|nr:S24 family peptidase [bacterium]
MHQVQQKILNFADKINLKRDGLRQIGRLIDEPHPFKISYHLNKLEKEGFIKIDKENGTIKKLKNNGTPKGLFLAIPVLGSANCGDANIIAKEHLEGYIKVSKKIVEASGDLIAIKASGNSMNKAAINKQNIEDGDYVIVNTNKQPQQNDYVLAIIDNCANIKKLSLDSKNKIISLVSESTENHPIIFIHETDKFLINGVVQYVIKKPIAN